MNTKDGDREVRQNKRGCASGPSTKDLLENWRRGRDSNPGNSVTRLPV